MATAGWRLRDAWAAHQPLQVVGAINAYSALLAEHAGHHALYLSGAGVANASFGLPDLGLISPAELAEDARRITSATDLPLLVDIDTGGGDSLTITRTVRLLEAAGVAGVQIEDQPVQKRCGHRPGKQVIPVEQMCERIRCAVAARSEFGTVIVARTDAYAEEGIAGVLKRGLHYLEAGADVLFPEALATLDEYQQLVEATQAPLLANITEFGKTPLFTAEQLHAAGVVMALYPLTAFRAQSQAAWEVYQQLKSEGHQRNLIERMQTRDELYQHLDYARQEAQQDAALTRKKGE